MRARSGAVSSSPPVATKRGRTRCPSARGASASRATALAMPLTRRGAKAATAAATAFVREAVEHCARNRPARRASRMQGLSRAGRSGARKSITASRSVARWPYPRSARQRKAFSSRSSGQVRLTSILSPVEPLVDRSTSGPVARSRASTRLVRRSGRSRLVDTGRRPRSRAVRMSPGATPAARSAVRRREPRVGTRSADAGVPPAREALLVRERPHGHVQRGQLADDHEHATSRYSSISLSRALDDANCRTRVRPLRTQASRSSGCSAA